MKPDALERELGAIASLQGVIGCAVVDVETGMAWKFVGGDDVQIVCEAATDFWRLHMRQSAHFEPLLGGLAAQVLMHARGRITLVRCAHPLLLVTLSKEPDHVDWAQWKARAGKLSTLVKTA